MAFLRDIHTGKPMRKCAGACKQYKFLDQFETPRMRTCIVCRARHGLAVMNERGLTKEEINERARAKRAYKAQLAGNINYKPRGPRSLGPPKWMTRDGHNAMQRERYRARKAALGKTVRGYHRQPDGSEPNA